MFSAYWRERLGTLLAVIPLGAWTVLHLYNNLRGFQGAEEWEQAVTHYPNQGTQIFVMVVVLGPLLYHAVWGIARIGVGRPNNLAYGTYANLKFALQRASAIGVLLFLGAHIWLAMLKPRFVEGHPESFADISREMHHHGPTLMVYMLGTLGVAFHLANGLQTAAMKLGMHWPRKIGDKLEWPFLLFGGLVLAMSWGAIYALYQAGT